MSEDALAAATAAVSIETPTPYSLLGLQPGADVSAVNAAFSRAARVANIDKTEAAARKLRLAEIAHLYLTQKKHVTWAKFRRTCADEGVEVGETGEGITRLKAEDEPSKPIPKESTATPVSKTKEEKQAAHREQKAQAKEKYKKHADGQKRAAYGFCPCGCGARREYKEHIHDGEVTMRPFYKCRAAGEIHTLGTSDEPEYEMDRYTVELVDIPEGEDNPNLSERANKRWRKKARKAEHAQNNMYAGAGREKGGK